MTLTRWLSWSTSRAVGLKRKWKVSSPGLSTDLYSPTGLRFLTRHRASNQRMLADQARSSTRGLTNGTTRAGAGVRGMRPSSKLHLGTFTAEGTFRAAIKKLDYLVDLGITAIELMPIADFAGR